MSWVEPVIPGSLPQQSDHVYVSGPVSLHYLTFSPSFACFRFANLLIKFYLILEARFSYFCFNCFVLYRKSNLVKLSYPNSQSSWLKIIEITSGQLKHKWNLVEGHLVARIPPQKWSTQKACAAFVSTGSQAVGYHKPDSIQQSENIICNSFVLLISPSSFKILFLSIWVAGSYTHTCSCEGWERKWWAPFLSLGFLLGRGICSSFLIFQGGVVMNRIFRNFISK